MVKSVIVDTDPGVDDVLALMLLFATPQVHVRAITLTHGNAQLLHVKRNAVTLMNVMREHRQNLGVLVPQNQLPVLAVGNAFPLNSNRTFVNYLHKDGLGDVYKNGTFTAPIDWETQLLHKKDINQGTDDFGAFRTTARDAADEILYQLKHAEPLTISILAIGPLTNVALAYQRGPIAFSRAKRVVIMGGAVDNPGNVTQFAEFNFYADPIAADIVMEISKGYDPTPEGHRLRMDLIQKNKKSPVHIVVFPLKGADEGVITVLEFKQYIVPLKTPLSVFCHSFLESTFEAFGRLIGKDIVPIPDAFTALLLLDLDDRDFDKYWEYRYLDLHVETTKHGTRGMSYYGKKKIEEKPYSILVSFTHYLKNYLLPIPEYYVPNNIQVIGSGNCKRFSRILLNRVFQAGIEE